MAQVVELSLPAPEDPDSNPAIGNFHNKYLSWFTNFNSNVVKISKKEADELENIIIKHNHEKGEANFSKTAEYVTITRLKAFESKNPEIYKI